MINAGRKDFPTSAGILLGLGMGGFFDGIVLHQLLQWHHMLTSAGYPADSVPNLEVNTFWDGLFHASTTSSSCSASSSSGGRRTGPMCAGRASSSPARC
jgi:uncharacterized membrane protein